MPNIIFITRSDSHKITDRVWTHAFTAFVLEIHLTFQKDIWNGDNIKLQQLFVTQISDHRC